MAIRKNRHFMSSLSPLLFDTVRLEGGLFVADLMEKICLGNGPLQSREDYSIPKGLKIESEYARAFHIAKAQWSAFVSASKRKDHNGGEPVMDFVVDFLRDVLGYGAIREGTSPVYVNGFGYPITLMIDGMIPVVVSSANGLDTASNDFGVEGGSRRKTPFQLVQEFLNARDHALWGIVTNGRSIRLLRDSSSLTRPCFLEFDLERIMQEERYSDFRALWYILHHSRTISHEATRQSIWEQWRNAGIEEGARVRDRLREGVGNALIVLGNGFISHPENEALRAVLADGRLGVRHFYTQLLRLIYRVLFVITIEERELIHPSSTEPEVLQLYALGYSFKRLRAQALRGVSSHRSSDIWHAVRIVFRGLAGGEPRLGLPALGGLFTDDQCPELDRSSLSNKNFLLAMRHLRWANIDGVFSPVDYRNMGPEELGSIYESLLEYEPVVVVSADEGHKFSLPGFGSESATAGNARKTTGSYYTPESLVAELIKSALDPTIERILQENPTHPTKALLDMTVIDPSCGSGHFLLAAARRIAGHIARLRSADDAIKPETYRHALRDVIARCIYGVDLNPLAVELARFTLWLEGYEPGRSLAFIDHHVKCGNSLIGLLRPEPLKNGIPKEAYTALSGDDKETCTQLKKQNKDSLKMLSETQQKQGMLFDKSTKSEWLTDNLRISDMPDGNLDEIASKKQEYETVRQRRKNSPFVLAADVYVGAFLLPKTEDTLHLVPTTESLRMLLRATEGSGIGDDRIDEARGVCTSGRVFHWFAEFPEIMESEKGGFDCVLGNPPWEVSQLSEEEYFSSRAPEIATLSGEKRKKAIAALGEENPYLWSNYVKDKRTFESTNQYCRSTERFVFTAVGKLNTYALFAETMSQILAPHGRAGFIVPSGIATDDSTKHFFADLVQSNRLISLYDFENRNAIFPGVHRSYKFCLMTVGASEAADYAFFLTDTQQLAEKERCFSLKSSDFASLNPNTKTCPIFRSRIDAELTRKIYARVPVLIREDAENEQEGNPWGLTFRQGLFNMTSDSHLFEDASVPDRLPLYEAKMIHQFDHRWASYSSFTREAPECKTVTENEKNDIDLTVRPRYWVDETEVLKRLGHVIGLDPDITDPDVLRHQCPQWLMGWRDICRATDERTVIASVLPRAGAGDTLLLMFPNVSGKSLNACLLADQNSLIHDFIARQKIGGMHLKYHVKKQITALPPESYSASDLDFIVPRVLELTYTSQDMEPWALDICPGYSGGPFAFDPDRRALIRADLDAHYAKLYGLTRDELRYVLDPADVMGADYPSETFRVLKNKELADYGEYRTQRLVLEAWDRLGY